MRLGLLGTSKVNNQRKVRGTPVVALHSYRNCRLLFSLCPSEQNSLTSEISLRHSQDPSSIVAILVIPKCGQPKTAKSLESDELDTLSLTQHARKSPCTVLF